MFRTLLVVALSLCGGRLRAAAPADPPALASAIRALREGHPLLRAAHLREEAARTRGVSEAGTAENERIRLTLDLERDLRLAWIDAWQAAQELRLNLREIQLTAQMESIATAGVSGSSDAMMTAQPDPLGMRAESLMASETRMNLLQAVTDAHARLQRLTGRETPPDPGDFPVLLPLDFETDAAALLQAAYAANPDLRDRQRLALEASDDDVESQAREAELTAERERLQAEVRIGAASVNNLRHHESLYRLHLLPLREQQVDRAYGEFASGAGGLRAVLDARRMLVRDQGMHVRHQAEAWREAARLEHLRGGGWIQSAPPTP